MPLLTMRPRDPGQAHRTATPLELFFDLVFVIAVAVAGVELHHQLAEDHVGDGVLAYVLVFFAIWWAWMNFTWFATSFDTDDAPYRVLTFVQMGGVLLLSAGIEPAFEDRDFTVATMGYVVMRVPMVLQWLRAARQPGLRRTALTYAGGIAAVQALWLLRLLLPEALGLVAFLVLLVAELAVPVAAESRGTTPWHPHHITERYGLFTIILLGESLLASANAILEALHADEDAAPLLGLGVVALVITASLWWLYFWPRHHEVIGGFRASLRYGYTHYVVFAAAGALSAGLEVQADVLTDHSELGGTVAALTLTVPLAVFVLGIWWLAVRAQATPAVNAAVPAAAAAILLVSFLPVPTALVAMVLVAMVLVAMVSVLATHRPREPEPVDP